MSGITRSDLYVRSLKVHNKSSNIMEMDLQGNLSLNTKSISSDVKDDLTLKSTGNQTLSTVDGNMSVTSKNGSVILRNGEYQDISSLSYDYNDLDVDENNTTYFVNNQIVKPYTDKDSVVALRDNSLLIESLGEKSVTTYSNNGINSVAHGSIRQISDEDCILQANRKINLTSLGFITLNSERVISSAEEDISFFSSTGDVLLGGNGVTNNGIKISSNTNNNFVGIGKSDDSNRNLDIEIDYSSNDNTMKNGITIENSNGSKNSDQNLLNPEILISNSTTSTKLEMGLGNNETEQNLKVIASKVNINSKTYIKPLNNFSFTLKDIGKIVTWTDSTFTPNTILGILNDSTHGVVALINTESSSLIETFSYQIGYINRNDFAYVRTKTSNDLLLGTNGRNILNITNSGNVGINSSVPNATFQVKNTYGEIFNNKINKNKIYTNAKSIQFTNGNILLLSSSVINSNYSLEGFLYNQNNQMISNFVVVTDSTTEIIFSVDHLFDSNDLAVIGYCYKKRNSSNQLCFFTETNIFKNDGSVFSSTLKNTIEHDTDMTQNSFPSVKAFSFSSNLVLDGYVLAYNDLVSTNKVNSMLQIFRSLTPGNLLSSPFNSSYDIYSGDTVVVNSSINTSQIIEITSNYLGVEIDNLNNDFLITYYNKITDINTIVNHHSFLQRFNFSETNQTYSLTRRNFDTSLYLNIRDEEEHGGGGETGYRNYQIVGTNIKEIETNTTNRIYLCIFYKKDTNGVKNNIFTKKITIQQGTSYLNSDSISQQTISETADNGLLLDIPAVDVIQSGTYVISWISNGVLYYRRDTSTNGDLKQISSSLSNQVNLLCINDLTGVYKETIIMWNNGDSTDLLNYNSISLKNILSTFNLFSITNDNNDIVVKNTGEININSEDKININQSVEVDKNGNRVNILKNLVISELSGDPIVDNLTGVNGQINYYQESLYIYINGAWKSINIS